MATNLSAAKLNGYAVTGPVADGVSVGNINAYAVISVSETTASKLVAYVVVNVPSTARPQAFIAT